MCLKYMLSLIEIKGFPETFKMQHNNHIKFLKNMLALDMAEMAKYLKLQLNKKKKNIRNCAFLFF